MGCNKIILKDSSNADSRTCKEDVTLDDVYEATEIHRTDVQKALEFFSEELLSRGDDHDFTKIIDFDNYGRMVVNGVKNDKFLASEWWNNHITLERHHLDAYSPIDVNLFDVLEMIADRVCAEKGRTGSINTNYLKLDSEILIRAYYNTIKLLDDNTQREG